MAERPNFQQLIANQAEEGKFLCIGLDIDNDLIPNSVASATTNLQQSVQDYAFEIIDATAPYAAAFKPNVGFYMAYLEGGIAALGAICYYIHETYPDIPVITDGKPGDVEGTTKRWAKGYVDRLRSDAVTLNPYLGQGAQQPFLDYPNTGCIVVCKTSNPGSGELQDRNVMLTHEEMIKWDMPTGITMPLYELIAHRVSKEWNANKNCGLVVGATYPKQMERVRKIVGDNMFLLVPGVGKQGGDLEAAVNAAKNSKGEGFLINASSSICHASKGDFFAEVSSGEAKHLHKAIQACLKS